MTVEQLISELQKFDPKMEVKTEGCDCFGDSAFLGLWKGDVMIWRADNARDDYPELSRDTIRSYKNNTILMPYLRQNQEYKD